MTMQSTEVSTQVSAAPRIRANGFFAWLGEGLNSYKDARARQDEIAALQAKSDEELARMGIARDRIVQHVFRDMMGI